MDILMAIESFNFVIMESGIQIHSFENGATALRH